MKNKSSNPLLCDVETGVCELPPSATSIDISSIIADKQPIRIIYYTDPICSTCWGIEPQLRKLKLEYGDILEIDYRMGGLLPDWGYNSGGISKPADVASHWDEVSEHYDMPIDGDVWLEDPLHSSYPPSIAFKAAQIQDEEIAVSFLRRLREMLFLEKKNITKWEHIGSAAVEVGLDPTRLKGDCEGRAKEHFKEDLELARKLGVRGFPTLFFSDNFNNKEMVYGFKPYQKFEEVVLKLFPGAVKAKYDTSWVALFNKYPTLTTKEFMELSGSLKQDSEVLLHQLVDQSKLKKLVTKNGVLWVK